MTRFYRLSNTYETLFKDGKQFRASALEILGDGRGAMFISACVAKDKHGIAKSDTKIEWGKAEDLKG
jgi:hypothetical protein